MEVNLVQGEQETVNYIPLDESWIATTFQTLKEATEYATARGWTANIVQMRQTPAGFIVERYDTTGCGCGG